MKKIILIVSGCLAAALATVGAFIPLLPTVPFLLLAAFCFARSSEKLHAWFTDTNLYKKNLQSYAEGHGMTIDAKLRIVLSVTVIMAIGFIMMSEVPVGRTVLAIIWALHLLYFTFGIKTLRS